MTGFQKTCPDCQTKVNVRSNSCTCGYDFHAHRVESAKRRTERLLEKGRTAVANKNSSRLVTQTLNNVSTDIFWGTGHYDGNTSLNMLNQHYSSGCVQCLYPIPFPFVSVKIHNNTCMGTLIIF